MKAMLRLAFPFIFSCSLNLYAQEEAILCMDSYPPFTYFKNDEPVGAMVDALKIIAERLDFTLKFTPNTPFARCLRMAEAGLIDFMVSLMPTPERLSYMAMFPYATEEPLRFIVLKSSHPNVRTELDLSRLKIGLVNGFLYPESLHSNGANVVVSPSPEAGIRQLRASRIDTLVLNETVAVYLIKNDGINHKDKEKPIELIDFSIPRKENANSIALSKKSPLMKHEKEVAEQIDIMRINGTFLKLIEAHQQVQ